MNGRIARHGFHFQDLYLLFRVLRAVGQSLDEGWHVGTSNTLDLVESVPISFGIETSPIVSEAPDWDVIVSTSERLEFAEVKSGSVTKGDRIAFWRRLRREIGVNELAVSWLAPILVIDPNKYDALKKWEALASTAAAFSNSPPQAEPAGNIQTASDLLNEALWYMCRDDESATENYAPATTAAAIAVLQRFELHCHVAEHLESEVTQLINLLFPDGLTESQLSLLLGWLGQRASQQDQGRQLFSIRELLAEIGILHDAISLTPGTIKKWRDLWYDAPQGFRSRTRMSLGQSGNAVPASDSQPDALNVISDDSKPGVLILGQGGSGKSVFIAQIAGPGITDDCFVCGADDVNAEELDILANAIRFRAAITRALRPESKIIIGIDGLDEADVSLRKRWGQIMIRLQSLQNVRAFASIRDADWRRDGELQRELSPWKQVSMRLWPESLVTGLLISASFDFSLPLSVIQLIRMPILFDLFWRTFVETATLDKSRAARLQTRHNLLAEFWNERLINSPRHSGIMDIRNHLNSVVSCAALHVGAFQEGGLDAIGIQVLLTEAVMVREGRIQPRLGFRHPLLRDFALAQWCLSTDSNSEVASRWSSIKGGLQRYGSLRALFEALSDPDSHVEYPQISLNEVIQFIIQTDSNYALQVAHVLGTRIPSRALDPAAWPRNVQEGLPPEFGRALLSAARMESNGSWAPYLEKWPDDTRWLNNDYPHELVRYIDAILQHAKSNPNDHELQENCCQVARKLRVVTEIAKFASAFSDNDRWLKMVTIQKVIPILPDQATLEWIERESAVSSWRTRSHVLEQLIHLAPVDPARVALLYERSVGLTNRDGRGHLDLARWHGLMDHHAIEWSLAGEDNRRSLLREYPKAFLPVVLNLAEALWYATLEDRKSASSMWADIFQKSDPTWSKEDDQKREQERQAFLGGLIDDSPDWQYWRGSPTNGPYERCLKSVHDWAKDYVGSTPETFVVEFIPMLRASRLATIRTIAMDLLLAHKEDPQFLQVLSSDVLDARFYYIHGCEYWVEQALSACWPILDQQQRSILFAHLSTLQTHPQMEFEAKRLLRLIPLDALPNELRTRRPPEDDPDYQPRTRPERADFNWTPEWRASGGEIPAFEIGDWPETFDLSALMELAKANHELSRKDISPEAMKDNVNQALAKAGGLLPDFYRNSELLDDPTRFWVWDALARMLDQFRRVRDQSQGSVTSPPFDVVDNCVALALRIVEHVPNDLAGALPEGDVWSGHSETVWEHALRLADASLIWPPARENEKVQERFIRTIEAAFATEQPLVQLKCAISIRPWHWLRSEDRRRLYERLVWNTPKDARVLAWSLPSIEHCSDGDQAKVFRQLLSRDDLIQPKELARMLGRFIGSFSMAPSSDGRRLSVTEVARDAISKPDAFPFLSDPETRNEFFGSMIFGMKEYAKLQPGRTELASDYGDWALKVWQILRAKRLKRNDSEGVILLAMHWLEMTEKPESRLGLRTWWQSLEPLFEAVVSMGGTSDCFILFFQLHSGKFNDLTSPALLMNLIDIFAKRVSSGAVDGTMDLDAYSRETDDYHSWRECAEFAADTIESIRRDGSLSTEAMRERAHQILTLLAVEPIRASKAVEALHRLQME